MADKKDDRPVTLTNAAGTKVSAPAELAEKLKVRGYKAAK